MDKFIGKRLDGRYEIIDIIGMGGMAIVYKAYDNVDDRYVAIKILKEEFIADDEFRRRFKNESKAIALLSHPNIVKVFDVSLGDMLQYYVMDYIEGISLKEYIEEKGVIDWQRAVHFTIQILRALQHAHDNGIVHRDVKPQNIMLLSNGTIKVTDFGIARFSRNNNGTLTDKAIGSVHYISPEQARGDHTDERSDIYAVGILLYEMVTGQLPFEAENAVSVAIMQMNDTPESPRSINPDIPYGIEEIINKAMQKEPSKRYQSATEMLSDIETVKLNPSIRFEYKFDNDDSPTKYIPEISENQNDNVIVSEENIDDNDSSDDNSKKGNGVKILVGIAIAFIVAMLVAGIYFTGPSGLGIWGSSKDDGSPCPNLIGKDYNTLINDPEYKEYTIIKKESKNDYSPQYESGCIIWQSPESGKLIKGKKEIEVGLSLGVKKIQLTDYKNYEKSTAAKSIQNLGLTCKVEEIYSDTVTADFVVKTEPPGGSSVTVGSEVILYVSKGPVPQIVQVPSLTGLKLEDAKAQIENTGLVVGAITKRSSKDYPENYVISQTPTAGTSANKNTTINLVVSTGQATTPVSIDVPVPSTIYHSFYADSYYNGGCIQSGYYPATSGTFNLTFNSNEFNPANDTPTVIIKINGYYYREYKLDFTDGTYYLIDSAEVPTDDSSKSSSSTSGGDTSTASK